jgi:hypothetical protein
VNFLFKGFDQGLEVKQPKSHQMLPRFRIVESKTTIFIRTSLRQDVLWYTNGSGGIFLIMSDSPTSRKKYTFMRMVAFKFLSFYL